MVLHGHGSGLWGILEICRDIFGGQDDWKELLALAGRRPGMVAILQFAGSTVLRIVLHPTWILSILPAIYTCS